MSHEESQLTWRGPMPMEDSQLEFSQRISRLFEVTYGSTIVYVAISAVIVFAALGPLTVALLVLGAAALLLAIGAAAFYNYTCIIKARYTRAPAAAAAVYGFPTYAALKASWPFFVRLVAC